MALRDYQILVELSEGKPSEYIAAYHMPLDEVVNFIETYNGSSLRKKEQWEYEHPESTKT